MTFHHHDGSAGPARLPDTMTIGEEFLTLMDLRDRTDKRLAELTAILLPEVARRPATRTRKLVQSALRATEARHGNR